MILHHGGFPIRKSVGQSLFAAHHGLSQLVTSFIGSWCQGIHLTLLFAWTSCIMYLTILWFSLNCLSFFELTFRIIDSCSLWKSISPFALCFELFHHVGEIVFFPFRLERLNNNYFVLFCSFSTQINLSSIQFSKICATSRLLVGLDGLEPSTSRLSGARSSHLSYKPE